MFKKLLSGALCLSMLLSTAIPAFAANLTTAGNVGQTTVSYGMDESFLVVIPADFTIGSSKKATADVKAMDVMLGANKSLAVTINGDDYIDKWELIDQTESNNKLTYTIGSTEGADDIINDSIVLLATAGESYNTIITKTLYFTVTDELTKAGTYNDTLTFTVYVDGGNALEGSGQKFHKMAPSALAFRSHEPLSEFQEVLINGETLDRSNYTLTEGSTIVTLDVDYLKNLSTSNYKIEIVSTNNSVAGNFSIVESNINSYGFYYNQPYAAYVESLGINAALLFGNNNVVNIAVYEDASLGVLNGTFELVDGKFVVNEENIGTLTFVPTDDEKVIRNLDLGIDFVLTEDEILADNDYVYAYSESLDGYVADTISKTKSEYGMLKYNINGKPLMKIASGMFAGNTNIINIPKFPEAWMISNNTGHAWGEGLFEGCTELTNVVIPRFFSALPYGLFADCTNLEKVFIPNSVTAAGSFVFKNCTSLTDVRFEGTIEELMSIPEFKYPEIYGTFENSPVEYITCSNGIVELYI